MNEDRAKSVILRRWRDAKERVASYRENGFLATDEAIARRDELTELFAELYPGENIAEAWEVDPDDDWDRRSSKARRERGLPPLPSYIGEREPSGFDFLSHLAGQRRFSEATFGPGTRTAGVVDHIRKELHEIEADPNLEEWIDVVILALDGAWRSGASPEEIVAALVAKQAKNESRKWPDWRTVSPGEAIEHIRKEPNS